MGPDKTGVYPGPHDIIITGRSFEEQNETRALLRSRGILNEVFMNPVPLSESTRTKSGIHKGETMKLLIERGLEIQIHFEDDPIQAAEIRKIVPEVVVVMLEHELVEK